MRLLWNPHGEEERDNEGRKMATTGLGLMGRNLAISQLSCWKCGRLLHFCGRWTLAETITPMRRQSFETPGPSMKKPVPSGSFQRAAVARLVTIEVSPGPVASAVACASEAPEDRF